MVFNREHDEVGSWFDEEAGQFGREFIEGFYALHLAAFGGASPVYAGRPGKGGEVGAVRQGWPPVISYERFSSNSTSRFAGP